MKLTHKLEEYTEAEFLALIEKLFDRTIDDEEYLEFSEKFALHFEAITEHPEGTNVIFYPPPDREDSPQGILDEVKRYRAEAGKPGFKTA
ncbi:bacteriocin immunity protein [Pseudomonas sp. App30]|uniref:bacteriocin immunity protein n=1 Tax=Pseudomonas sp. App30 TaxID=3068990 RepID=UPI003A7F786B